MTDDAEIWHLTFRVLPGPTPGVIRVRRLLKIARGHGLICTRVSGEDGQTKWLVPEENAGAARRPAGADQSSGDAGGTGSSTETPDVDR